MAVDSIGGKNIIIDELLSLVDGNPDGLTDIASGGYAEIAQVFGGRMALEMYVHFRGCTINCPKHFFTQEFVVRTASKCQDRRGREKIAIICGYTSQWIERKVREQASCKANENTAQA
jgi:hypothetical protein